MPGTVCCICDISLRTEGSLTEGSHHPKHIRMHWLGLLRCSEEGWEVGWDRMWDRYMHRVTATSQESSTAKRRLFNFYSLADFRQLQFTNMCATLCISDRSESFGSYRVKALGRLCHEIIDVDQSSVMKSVLSCPCMRSLASSGLQNGGSMLQCC